MNIRSALVVFAVTVSVALALPAVAEDPPLEPLPEPPPLPEGQSLEESLAPQVRIVREEDKVITQYVVEGVVRAVKVEHSDSTLPSYYLVDTDGDGRLDRRSGVSGDQEQLVAHWIVATW